MALKLVLISPTGTLLKDNQLHPKLVSELSGAIQRLNAAGVKTAIWSNRYFTDKEKKPLDQFFSETAGCQVEYIRAGTADYPARRRAGSVDPVLAHFGVSRSEAILVG